MNKKLNERWYKLVSEKIREKIINLEKKDPEFMWNMFVSDINVVDKK